MALGIQGLLTPRELLELAALSAGIKEVVRFTIRPRTLPQLRLQCSKKGFDVFAPALFTRRLRKDADSNEFVDLTETCADEASLQVAYVSQRGERKMAARLYDLEHGDGTSESIGQLLGYPPCCCCSYKGIETGGDWLETMLVNTPSSAPAFAACNRCARVFGDWAVLPDYFPCSFSCRRSALLAERIDRAGQACGLTDYLNVVWRELAVPIAIAEDNIVRLHANRLESTTRHTNCGGAQLNWIRAYENVSENKYANGGWSNST